MPDTLTTPLLSPQLAMITYFSGGVVQVLVQMVQVLVQVVQVLVQGGAGGAGGGGADLILGHRQPWTQTCPLQKPPGGKVSGGQEVRWSGVKQSGRQTVKWSGGQVVT